LAKEAFDRARSIDPSLALPWAGMSAENYHQSGYPSPLIYEKILYFALHNYYLKDEFSILCDFKGAVQ